MASVDPPISEKPGGTIGPAQTEGESSVPEDDTSKYVEIPKILNFIWVGNPLPEKYQANLKNWRALNPDYEINLWVDKDLLTKEQFETLEKFCTENKLTMIDIVKKVKDKNDKIWYKRDLNAYYDSVIGENRNWAVASNILRAIILEEMGGIYLDTDISPRKKRPLGTIKVPPHGLLLSAIYSPIDDISAALADNIMGCTKGHAVIKEFSRLMQEKYKAFLNSNEDVLTMRSRILSTVTQPTYEIVGPDVVAEAFLNVEIEKIPFGPYLNREKIKDKLIDQAFDIQHMKDIFDHYFSEEFDNTWVSPRNETAYDLYETLVEKTAIKPLLDVLNKIEKDDLELNDHYKKVKEIFEKPESLQWKLDQVRILSKQDPKAWQEIHAFLRPGYYSTIVMNDVTKLSKLENYSENKQWKEFIALLEIMKKEKKEANTLEAPRKFTDAIVLKAAENQPLFTADLLFKNRNYEKCLLDAIEDGEEPAVKALLETDIDLSKTYYRHGYLNAYQIAIESGKKAVANMLLQQMLGDSKGMFRTKEVDVDAELRNQPQILIQAGDDPRLSPAILKFFSNKTNDVVTINIQFNAHGKLHLNGNSDYFGNKLDRLEFSNLTEIVDYIKSTEKPRIVIHAEDIAPKIASLTSNVKPLETDENSVDKSKEVQVNDGQVKPGLSYQFDKLQKSSLSPEQNKSEPEKQTLETEPKVTGPEGREIPEPDLLNAAKVTGSNKSPSPGPSVSEDQEKLPPTIPKPPGARGG